MKSYFAKLTLVLLLSSFSIAANAAAWCTGKVTNAYTDIAGTFTIKGTWRNDYTAICNVRTAISSVDPLSCRTWVSTILTAMSKASDVVFMYTDPITNCATIPTYANAPAPNYVMLGAL